MKNLLIFVASTILLASCPTSAETPPPASPTPEPTFTSRPTIAPSDTPTPRPLATATTEAGKRSVGACDMAAVLEQVREGSPYAQFAAHHNIVENVSSLIVWFVDPELDAATGEVAIVPNQELALRHALQSIHRVSRVDECLAEDIDLINIVVVDRSYHGWLSVQLSPEAIGAEDDFNQEVFDQYLNEIQASYLRSEASELVPDGECTWPQAEQDIWNHFSRDRKNLAFYHVIDEFGINVWAQWDGPSDFAAMSSNILNILMEISCLDPRTNLIFMIVDDEGYTQTFGLVPQLNPDNLAILYER